MYLLYIYIIYMYILYIYNVFIIYIYCIYRPIEREPGGSAVSGPFTGTPKFKRNFVLNKLGDVSCFVRSANPRKNC